MTTLTHNELAFARNLDEKLKNIDVDNERTTQIFIKNNITHSKNLKNLKNSKMNRDRPQFITTVKKGRFLEPPAEVAVLLGLQRSLGSTPLEDSSGSSAEGKKFSLYSYSSKPRVQNGFHADCGRRKRSTELNNSIRDGAGPYANIMFDRRVIRGTTCSLHGQNMPKWNPNFAYARLLSCDEPRSSTEDLTEKHREARRRAQVRKKARGLSALRRGRHGTPPPAPGRRHEPVQTDQYLEEILDPPPETEAACQTDLFLEPITAPVYYPAPDGIDKATQVYPGELIDLEEVLGPIVKSLVNRTLEKSLLEVLEEEQMADLQEQQSCLQEYEAAKLDEERALSPCAIGLRHGVASTTGLYYLIIDASEIAAILMTILAELQNQGRLVQGTQLPPPGLLQELLEELQRMTRSYPIIREIIEDLLRGRGLLLPIHEEKIMGEEAEEALYPEIFGEMFGEKETPRIMEIVEGEDTEQPIYPDDQIFFGGKEE